MILVSLAVIFFNFSVCLSWNYHGVSFELKASWFHSYMGHDSSCRFYLKLLRLIQKWFIDMKNHLMCSAIAYVLQLYISIIYNLCIEPIPFIYLYCFYFPPSNKQLLECIVLNKSLFISFFINVNSCFWDFLKTVFYILYALLQHMFCSSAFRLFTTCVSNQYHLFTCILYIFPF